MKTYFCRAKPGRNSIKEERIIGNCLEAIGIPNGGIAVIDANEDPRIGDVIWCNNRIITVRGFLKQVVELGDTIIVSTRYKDKTKDYTFEVSEVYGVVLKVMDYDRNVVWERDKYHSEMMT